MQTYVASLFLILSELRQLIILEIHFHYQKSCCNGSPVILQILLYITIIHVNALKNLKMFSSPLMGRSIIKISVVSLHYHFLCIISSDISQVSFLISMKRMLLSDCAF